MSDKRITLRDIRRALNKLPRRMYFLDVGRGIDESALIEFYKGEFEQAGIPIYKSENLVRYGGYGRSL